MGRKVVSLITLIAFSMTLGGCYHHRLTSPSTLSPHQSYQITEAVLQDGQIVKFVPGPDYTVPRRAGDPEWGWPTIQDTLLVGWVKDELARAEPFSTPISNVRAVNIRNLDVAATIGMTLVGIVGLAVVILVIAILTKESCPFIYSYDGSHYVFDGEPYGGATCPALQRTDYCALDSLRPVNGEYRLLLTNEVDETQHTDELTLLAVDHPPEMQIIMDNRGNPHTVTSPLPVSRAVDARGTDLTKWLTSNDLLVWENDPRVLNPQDPADLRDSLWLTFPRPAGVSQAKLVINAGTTLWGSQMLKQSEELWGDQLAAWQASLQQPMVRFALETWNRREEAYTLFARVRVNGDWVPRGEILGGGPFMTESRIVPLSLEGVEGDQVEVLLTPPAGFWQFNWMALDTSADVPLNVHEISAQSAIGHDGGDIREALKATDGVFYTAPETGQTAHLSFPVPDLADGLSRTVFARASGYYDIHHATVPAAQDSVLQRVRNEPNYFARLALERFQTWYAQQMASRVH